MVAFVRFTKLFFALGLLALAAAIVFFSLEIRQFRQQLPDILKQVDETSQRITPIIDEIAELKEFLPLIIKQSEGYQKLIPEVLVRVDMINQQMPTIINEISAVTQSIEPILKDSKAWRSELPALLAVVKETNVTIGNTNQQLANTLPNIPLILAESEALRNEVPIILTQAESLVGQVEQAGQEASKGVVTGIVGGILSTPFSLIGKIGESTTKMLGLENADSLSKSDRKSYNQAMERLMKKPSKGANQSWRNDDTGNKGTITISDVVQQEQKNCYHFTSQFFIAKGDDKGSHKLTTEACKEITE